MISESLPIDLITEILLKLPGKSIARFRSVSKQWASIIDHQQFKAILDAVPHPRLSLIFAIEKKGFWSIFSSPQHQPKPSSSSLAVVVTPEFHMNFPPDNMRIFSPVDRRFSCGYASGLIYFHAMVTNDNVNDYTEVSVVCNPKTGRYEALPWLSRYRKTYSFFGFDPVGKQYKVLHMTYPSCSHDHRIMTLGTRGMRWRKIHCPSGLEHMSDGLCINGVLYCLGDASEYVNETLEENCGFAVACFDVRSETFSFLYPESFCELINYNGKLGLVYYDDLTYHSVELRVWVLEDLEKGEWSKYAFDLRDYNICSRCVSVVGVISTGEIVFSMTDYTSGQPFYVFYFNPEENTIRRFEIQGFGEHHEASSDNPSRVRVFVDDCSSFNSFADHVEHLNVNDGALLKSSIYSPYVYNEESEEEDEGDNGEDWCYFRGRKKRG